MLVLTRKLGESIRIGTEIRLTVLEVKGKQVKVGIDAPCGVTVHRDEIYRLIEKENMSAVSCRAGNNKEELSSLWKTLLGKREATR